MSEDTTNKNARTDEIDLLDLFRRIGRTLQRWSKGIGRTFLILIVFLLKKWIPLTISIILGVVVSLLLKITSDSFYTSDLVLRNNTVSNADMISHLNRLHTYCLENNMQALADAISVPLAQVNNIKDIGAFWVIDEARDGYPDYIDYRNAFDIFDTLNIRMQNRIDLRVKINVPQELSLIRNGILNFINKDSLFQLRNRVRIRQNNELIARLDYDIFQLDSLQKIKYFEETKNRQPANGGQMIFLQEQKTQLVYPEIQLLYAKKQTIESDQELYNGIVTVISDFTLPGIRDNGGFYYAKIIIPLFFGLTLILLLLYTNRKKLKEVYQKY
jgi:hypothetical protein